jgi:hypothetical protein
LISIIGPKFGDRSVLDSEEAVNTFVTKIWSSTLSDNIRKITKSTDEGDDVRILFNSAREARNFIAHQVTVGYESIRYDSDLLESQIDQLKEQLRKIAEADRFICILLSLMTREPIPKGDFVNKYPDRVLEWAIGDFREDA